jgi:hypothetical protein
MIGTGRLFCKPVEVSRQGANSPTKGGFLSCIVLNLHRCDRPFAFLGLRWINVCLLCFTFQTALHQTARAQTDTSTSLNFTRLAIVGGTVAVGVTAIHLYQQNAWWKEYRTSFHFREDLVYARSIDKLGHLYASSVGTFLFSKSLQWCNMSEPSSLLWGAVGSTLFQTYIEIEDGFSAYWGFDRVDYAADILGAWYPVLQHQVPVFKNFQFRFSYLPKHEGGAGAIPGQTKTIFDDYEGQTIWLTITPGGLFSEKTLGWWPDWLAIAAGVSVRDNNSPARYLVWFLAPDLDMTRIIPQDTWFLRTLGEALNFIHFPMPAVRVSPGVVWYGLYF